VTTKKKMSGLEQTDLPVSKNISLVIIPGHIIIWTDDWSGDSAGNPGELISANQK
jgi:hypothetical protein